MKIDGDQTLSVTLYLMILIKNKPQVKTTADANQKQLNRTAFIKKKHGSIRKHYEKLTYCYSNLFFRTHFRLSLFTR